MTIRISRLSSQSAALAIFMAVAAVCLGALAAPAAAADRIYWSNGAVDPNPIAYANLDGSGGANIDASGMNPNAPKAIVLDSATGRIYVAAQGGKKIHYANLEGGGTGVLDTTGAPVDGPIGLAIDPVARRVYWANDDGNTIGYAGLDGGGGSAIATTGATMNQPYALALDAAGGRIYWANYADSKISYARLDGTGGGDLNTTGTTISGPRGVTLDLAAGRLYVTNHTGQSVSYVRLDNSGGGDLPTTGATKNFPEGIAFDPDAGRLYWTNTNPPGKIAFAATDGSGGGDLSTAGATTHGPVYPLLLKRPVGTGAPAVSGASTLGSQLSCSQGEWAADIPASSFYRAPLDYSYQWNRGANPIAGATAPTYTADARGTYTCTVSAENAAGTTAQTSAPVSVGDQSPPGELSLSKARLDKRKGTATVKATVGGPGKLSLSGKDIARQTAMANAAGTVALTIKAKGPARQKLKHAGKVRVDFEVTFEPTGGGNEKTRGGHVKLKRRR
jgi:DNA-binding beta-propeller fold protein YncE